MDTKPKKFEPITDNDDGTKTVHFSDRPVAAGDTRLNQFVMREPTVADQLAVKDKDLAEREVALFANLCEQDPAVIMGMKLSQYGRLQRAYQDFMR